MRRLALALTLACLLSPAIAGAQPNTNPLCPRFRVGNDIEALSVRKVSCATAEKITRDWLAGHATEHGSGPESNRSWTVDGWACGHGAGGGACHRGPRQLEYWIVGYWEYHSATASVASAKQYMLKRSREHCRAHYAKRIEKVHKHHRTVKVSACVYVPPKATPTVVTPPTAPATPASSTPATPAETTPTTTPTPTPPTTTTPAPTGPFPPFSTTTRVEPDRQSCEMGLYGEGESCTYLVSVSVVDETGTSLTQADGPVTTRVEGVASYELEGVTYHQTWAYAVTPPTSQMACVVGVSQHPGLTDGVFSPDCRVSGGLLAAHPWEATVEQDVVASYTMTATFGGSAEWTSSTSAPQEVTP